MPGKHARETPFPSRQQLGHWTERLRGALWTSLNRGRVDARVLRETERERPQARVTMEHVRYDDPSLVAQVSARIQERIKQVDELLQAIGRSQPKLAGMGTTVTVLAVLPPHALVAHVGHARAYPMRGGELRQVTRDHTVAQKLVDAGLIDAEDVSRHPASSVLTRAAGRSRGRLPVDVHRLSLIAGEEAAEMAKAAAQAAGEFKNAAGNDKPLFNEQRQALEDRADTLASACKDVRSRLDDHKPATAEF